MSEHYRFHYSRMHPARQCMSLSSAQAFVALHSPVEASPTTLPRPSKLLLPAGRSPAMCSPDGTEYGLTALQSSCGLWQPLSRSQHGPSVSSAEPCTLSGYDQSLQK